MVPLVISYPYLIFCILGFILVVISIKNIISAANAANIIYEETNVWSILLTPYLPLFHRIWIVTCPLISICYMIVGIVGILFIDENKSTMYLWMFSNEDAKIVNDVAWSLTVVLIIFSAVGFAFSSFSLMFRLVNKQEVPDRFRILFWITNGLDFAFVIICPVTSSLTDNLNHYFYLHFFVAVDVAYVIFMSVYTYFQTIVPLQSLIDRPVDLPKFTSSSLSNSTIELEFSYSRSNKNSNSYRESINDLKSRLKEYKIFTLIVILLALCGLSASLYLGIQYYISNPTFSSYTNQSHYMREDIPLFCFSWLSVYFGVFYVHYYPFDIMIGELDKKCARETII